MVDQNEGQIDLSILQDPEIYLSNGGLVDAFLIGGSGAYIKDSVVGNKNTWVLALNMMNFGMKQFNENFQKSRVNDYVNKEYEKLLIGIVELQERLGVEVFSADRLLSMSERVNSKFLWEKFQENNQDMDLIDDSILEMEQKKRHELTELKQAFLNSKSDSLRQTILAVESEIEKIQLDKEQRYPNYVKYGKYEFDVLKLQKELGKNECVYKFELANEQLLKFEISQDGIRLRNLGSFDSIRNDVNLLIEGTRNPSASLAEINISGQRLYTSLIGENPLEDVNLIVVTDDVLNYLPFDLLRDQGSYLFEKNLVSYVTSLSLLDLTKKEESVASVGIYAPSYDNFTLSPQQLAVRGAAYNLDGALEEANLISSLVNADQFVKEKASKSKFLESSSRYDVLHLSMHSFLNDEDPELSSLVFHDGTTDNELYISELYGLNLKASLAVLSACNTGVGMEKTGEGVISMTRAFTYAGVPSVVSSLWSAPDKATKDIMTHFYRELKSGKTKTEALRNAKIQYIESQDVKALAHPFYWAGFVIHGNTNPMSFKGQYLGDKITNILIALVLLLGLITGVKLITRRKRTNLEAK